MLQDFTVSVDSGVADKWDGSSKAQPSGSGTAASPYKLGTAAQLAWFADTVNSGSRSACAVLTADIDLNGQEWTPIANSGVNNGYTGTFDGQGHVIHGICVTTGVSSRPQGLFGIIARTGTVRNVKAAGRVLVRQSSGAGLIAGENNGVLYNCEASAFLKNSYNAGSTGSSVGNIGGIAGHMAAGYIENCRAYGLFLANPESYDEGNLVNSSMLCQIGGIVGRSDLSVERLIRIVGMAASDGVGKVDPAQAGNRGGRSIAISSRIRYGVVRLSHARLGIGLCRSRSLNSSIGSGLVLRRLSKRRGGIM